MLPLKILVDENVPYADAMFAPFGEIRRFAGRTLAAAELGDAQALIVRSVTRVDRDLLAGSQIKFVGSCTIGADHLDMDYLARSGIAAYTAPGCNANSVADYVISVICACGDRLEVLRHGGRVGLVGFGNVGRTVAERLARLSIDSVAYDPLLAQDSDPRLSTLDEVLRCEVMSVHAPLTTGGNYPSYHMLTAKQLSSLPDGALLISAGRGGVIATHDLLALKQQRPDIHLAMDVWEGEPSVDKHLADLCLIATPHIAGYSLDGKVAGTRMIAERLADYVADSGSGELALPGVALPRPSIGLKAEGDNALLREAVAAVYDVCADDKRFRESLLAEDPAKQFDALRKHYPERREFAFCDYRGAGKALSAAQLNLLAALQGSK